MPANERNHTRDRAVALLVIKGYPLRAVGHLRQITGEWARVVTIRECLERLGKEFIRRGNKFYLCDPRHTSVFPVGIRWLRKHYRNRLMVLLS